jgi:AAA15 family ATPase/GTPase
MVKEIKIQNYKSVQDLTLELGRINVLIGANGCGKSNILEAIAFGSAAADGKLGNEFFASRGIRITEAKSMKSGFYKITQQEPIIIKFWLNNIWLNFSINQENKPFSNWELSFENFAANVKKIGLDNDFTDVLISQKIPDADDYEGFQSMLSKMISMYPMKTPNRELNNFLLYAPENTFLRRFEEESQIEPLGIRGEGLFKLLSVMSQETPEEFQEIIENLELIDWFEGFEIPKDLVFTERRIRIKDRFLEEGLQYFDQRSSNEGFLFLMFYFALFISKYTPKFFAIDNIDASLNPKLCIELIKILTKLAKKHDKQVIFTTHNPAILDGLNLNDDEVRLLVVNRNVHGHTKVKRVLKKEMPEGVEPLRLSEQFMRGYLGGLPKNF